jgi:outer membrane receptor protein involved in Fe transport
VALFVRNALDEEYVPVAFQINPANPNDFIGENGAPRTLGLSIGISF